MNDLLKANEELTAERDAKLQEIANLRGKLAETQASEEKLVKERDEAHTKLQEVHSCLFMSPRFIFSSLFIKKFSV